MKKSLIVAALLSASAYYTCGPVSAQSAYSFNINGHHVDIAVPRHCADLSCISVWTGPVGPTRRTDRRRPPRDSVATAEPTVPKPRAPKKSVKTQPPVTQPAITQPATPSSAAPSDEAQTQTPVSRPSAPPPAPVAETKQPEPKTEDRKPEVAAPSVTADTAKEPEAKPDAKSEPVPANPQQVDAQPQQAETKPAPDAKPQPAESNLVKRADATAAMPEIASDRSGTESASPQAQIAQNDADRDARDTDAADVRVPLPPAEQQRIVAAVNEPSVNGATEMADETTASPLGFWITELGAEKVHIVLCGKELCGYAVDPKTEHDRSGPIVRMKPVGARKWSGRINDARGTGSYASTISQKEADILHVQGCAFKGFMCDGQIWRRAS